MAKKLQKRQLYCSLTNQKMDKNLIHEWIMLGLFRAFPLINWIWILVLFLTPLPELTSNGFDPQNLVVSETSHVFCSRVSGLLKHRVLEGSGLWPQLNCEMKWSLELDTHVLMAVQQCQGPIGPHAHKFQEKDRIHTLTWSGWLRNVLGYSRTHFCFSKTRQH